MIRPFFLVFALAASIGLLRAGTPLAALEGNYAATDSTGSIQVKSVSITSSGRVNLKAILWSHGPDDFVGRSFSLVGTTGRARIVKRGGGKVLITRLDVSSPGRPRVDAVARVEERIVRGRVRGFSGKVFYEGKGSTKFTVRRVAKE